MIKQAFSDNKVYVVVEYKNWDINRSSGTTGPEVLFKLLIYKLDKVNH